MHLPAKPPYAPKHSGERLKLAASGLQAFALALFGAFVIAPALNASVVAPCWAQLAAFLLSGSAEVVACAISQPRPPRRSRPHD